MVNSISIDGWDGKIDWDKVKKDPHDIGLVFVRSSGDNLAEDKKFEENFNAVRKYGMQVGVIHDFGMVSSPEQQLKHISSMLVKVNFDRKTDKLVVHATKGFGGEDHEYPNVGRGEALKNLLERLQDYNPIIRTSPGVWDTYYASDQYNFSSYPLWVFNPSQKTVPDLPKDWKSTGRYEHWTYNTRDIVQGIPNAVCLNKDFYDKKQEVRLELAGASISPAQGHVQSSSLSFH